MYEYQAIHEVTGECYGYFEARNSREADSIAKHCYGIFAVALIYR